MATIPELDRLICSYRAATSELVCLRAAITAASENEAASKCTICISIAGEPVYSTDIPMQLACDYFQTKQDSLCSAVDEMDGQITKIQVKG
jgi:hypothetical protein